MEKALQDFLEARDWPTWAESAVLLLPSVERAVLLLVAGWILAKVSTWLITLIARRISKKKDLDGTVWDFIVPLPFFIVMGIFLLLAAEQFGWSTAKLIKEYGEPGVRAVIILAFAWFVAGKIASSINRFGQRLKTGHKRDNTLFAFLSSVARYSVVAFAFAIALQQFGSLSSLTAVVGAAAIAVGLALQDTLKAVAGGVMLAAFRPFRLGDWVQIDGQEGEVIDIAPFTTTIVGTDNRTVILPNTQTWGQTIVNYTRRTKRRLDLYFDISYDDDIDYVTEVLRRVFSAEDLILNDDGLWFGVHAFDASSVKIRARGWCYTRDFLQAKTNIMRAVKYAFDEYEITIPYMQQVEMSPHELQEWQAEKAQKVKANKARLQEEMDKAPDEPPQPDY